MGLEAATYVNDLTATNPLSTDKRKQGDDHLRLIKTVLKNTFPNADRAFYLRSYEAISGNKTVAASDMNKVFGASTAGGALTVTLPVSLGAGAAGYTVDVVKLETNGNRVTVAPSSGTLNGFPSLSITNTGDRITATWTGSTWVASVILAGVDKIAVTGSITVDETHFDKLLDVVPASANATITLPAAAGYLGRTLTVKLNSATYTCTLTPNLAETIDGASSWLLENQYEYVQLLGVTDGWFVLAVRGLAASSIPAGASFDYWGSTAPSGYLFAYGQAVSRTTYAKLFAKLGTTYGVGDGSTTFNLPDKRGRVSIGKDDMGGSAANRVTTAGAGLDGTVLGAAGGAETHTLTVAQTPAHTHFVLANASTGDPSPTVTNAQQVAVDNSGISNQIAYTMSGTSTAATIGKSSSVGSGTAHPNVQPSIVANHIIKY